MNRDSPLKEVWVKNFPRILPSPRKFLEGSVFKKKIWLLNFSLKRGFWFWAEAEFSSIGWIIIFDIRTKKNWNFKSQLRSFCSKTSYQKKTFGLVLIQPRKKQRQQNLFSSSSYHSLFFLSPTLHLWSLFSRKQQN